MSASNHILIVEDNEDDVYFIRRALKAAAPGASFHIVNDGRAALEYLQGKSSPADSEVNSRPTLVFLDLKLPFVNGLDVLAAIRGDPHLKDLTVYILTSSAEERDQTRARQLGVQGYFIKPPTPEMLRDVLSAKTA